MASFTRISRCLLLGLLLVGRVIPGLPNICLSEEVAGSNGGAKAEAALNRWLDLQKSIDTWRAEFTQRRTFPTLTHPLTSQGIVMHRTPGQFLWKVGDPPKTLIARTEKGVLIYYPQLKRAEKYALEGQTENPWKESMALLDAGFVPDRKALDLKFNILLISFAKDKGRISLQPKNKAARKFMPEIIIEFEESVPGPSSVEFIFTDGAAMRNEFSNPAMNPDLPEEAFELSLPDDVEISEPLSK